MTWLDVIGAIVIGIGMFIVISRVIEMFVNYYLELDNKSVVIALGLIIAGLVAIYAI